MARKLSNDEIKWILNIETSGARKEIAAASDQINKLAAANKRMATEKKAAEKQIAQQEKAMERLTKAGMENSEAFREAEATRNSARAEMEDYTIKMCENSRAIEENTTKIGELKQGMSLTEMTMSQLREPAADLQKQLNNTSASANPKEFNALNKDLSAVKARIGEVSNEGKSLMQQFAAMPHPVGTAAKTVMGFGTALKKLAMNPVGAIIMAIALAFTALRKGINSSEEAMNKFQQILAPLRLLFDRLLYIIQKVTVAVLGFVQSLIEGISRAIDRFPFLNRLFGEANEAAREAVQLERQKQELRVRERESLITNARKQKELDQLRAKAQRTDKHSYEQIIGFLDEVVRLEREIMQEKLEQAELALYIAKQEAARNHNSAEAARNLAKATAELYNIQAKFHQNMRRVERERAAASEGMRKEQETAAREALQRRIADVDFALKQETKLLRQQLVDGIVTREEHDRLLEQKTLESLHRRLQIVGLDRDQRIAIEKQILDFKLRALEQEEQNEQKRIEIRRRFARAVMRETDRELQDIRDRADREIAELEDKLHRKLITEKEFNDFRAIVLETQEKELAHREQIHRESEAARELERNNERLEQERFQLMEQFANQLIDREMFNEAMLELDRRFALKSLEISDLTDQQKMAARKRLLEMTIAQNERETQLQQQEQERRIQLYSDFSEQIGTILGATVAGNENLVKSSLRAVLNMALDALQAQVTMAVASATAQSFAQPDSVLSFGASGAVRAAVLTGLITAAFAGVRAVVNSALSGSNRQSVAAGNEATTGRFVVSGRESGGYFDVERAQDGKRYIAKFDPMKRGFVDKPTVLVGDGPAGNSKEWVASNDALKNPTIAPFIRMLDSAQQAGTIRTIDLNQLMRVRMAGFQSGGFISGKTPSGNGSDLPADGRNDAMMQVLKELANEIAHLRKNGVKGKATVVLSDLEAQQELRDVSRKIGSK